LKEDSDTTRAPSSATQASPRAICASRKRGVLAGLVGGLRAERLGVVRGAPLDEERPLRDDTDDLFAVESRDVDGLLPFTAVLEAAAQRIRAQEHRAVSPR
jgi:hypothetical protein